MTKCAFLNCENIFGSSESKDSENVSTLKKFLWSTKNSDLDSVYIFVNEDKVNLLKKINKNDAIIMSKEKFKTEYAALKEIYPYYNKILYINNDLDLLNSAEVLNILECDDLAVGYLNSFRLNVFLIPKDYLKNLNGDNIIKYLKENNFKPIEFQLREKINFKYNLNYQMKLTLFKDEKFFGPGIAELLKLINKTDSVKDAANVMNISYSKAWKIIRTMEKELGISIIESKQGGSGGGESRVTEEGNEFLRKYELFLKRSRKCTNDIFHEIFLED